jgi:ribonucleoside-diphosphate reductase alpha chain
MLNVRYGSEESVSIVESIYESLAVATELSSTTLAEERGAFPIYDHDLEKNNPYLRRVAAGSILFEERWKKFGRRNISTTTTAPCGSVSIMTRTTSGIEPAFLLSYTRRKKVMGDSTKVDFVDVMGDKWQEYTVNHRGLQQWMEITGESDISKSPYMAATSNDVDWVMSVKLQAAAQKYISHSISKTCNLPASATRETVKEVYMKAWELGCKGMTIYRDGCRDGVLVSNDQKKSVNDFRNHDAPKRPLELLCDVHQVRINGEAWTVLVGLLDGKPYELFGGLSKFVELPKKVKKGRIVKNGKKDGLATYNLVIGEGDDRATYKDIVSLFENPNNGAFTRTISLALRHGASAQFVAEQLLKDKISDMQSFSRVIARVLKGYIPAGTKPAGGQKCPECGGDLAYIEGCVSCKSCSWTKCQ